MTGQAVEIRTPSALAEQLRTVKGYLERLLPDPARFGTTLMVAARRNPEILRCDPASVVGAALVCAQLELEPGPAEHVWLIPRRNKHTGTIDCTLLLGYKGMKALAERHPAVASVRTGTICSGDEYEHTAQPPSLRHVPNWKERGDPVLWYAVAERSDGGAPHIVVLDRDAVEERRAKSASPNVGPWKSHYDQMAKKSAIRALWSELPSSLDMKRAAEVDDAGVVVPQDLGIPPTKSDPPKQLSGRLVDEQTGEILAEGDLWDTEPAPDDEPDAPIDVSGAHQPALEDEW